MRFDVGITCSTRSRTRGQRWCTDRQRSTPGLRYSKLSVRPTEPTAFCEPDIKPIIYLPFLVNGTNRINWENTASFGPLFQSSGTKVVLIELNFRFVFFNKCVKSLHQFWISFDVSIFIVSWRPMNGSGFWFIIWKWMTEALFVQNFIVIEYTVLEISLKKYIIISSKKSSGNRMLRKFSL